MEKQGLFTKISVFALLFMFSGTSAFATFDVEWTFGNVGSFSYRLDAFSPANADLGAESGSENPTLTLYIGKRYQVTVTNYVVHPFEVLAKGASAGSDIQLLSMGGTTGLLESDPDISWEDNGSGTVAFTMTIGLYNQMIENGRVPGYRCRPHASLMRGDFNILGIPLMDPIPEPIEAPPAMVCDEVV